MNTSRQSLFLIAAFVLVLTGCDSNGASQEMPPPVLPADAFTLSTDLFQQGRAPKAGQVQGLHFTAAALRVWPVSVILGANLVIPAAVTGAALQADPVLEDGAWVWSSTTRADGRDVAFSLRATPAGSALLWSMRVTLFDAATGQELDDFELYTARTDTRSASGNWQLFYRIDGERRNVLNADFDVAGETGGSLTFSVPETADRHAGDTVRYEHRGEDRAFFWQQVDQGLDHLIAWNALTRAGSITATNYNGGEKACWDAALNDVPCAD